MLGAEGREAGDLGPHRCPDRKDQRHQREPLVLDAAVVVDLEKPPSLGTQAAIEQVHDKEGEVVEDVDRGQPLAELQAVEQHRPAVQEHDVGEVQVAMAAAHRAGLPAAVEQAGLPI